jgi:hypothetical protein
MSIENHIKSIKGLVRDIETGRYAALPVDMARAWGVDQSTFTRVKGKVRRYGRFWDVKDSWGVITSRVRGRPRKTVDKVNKRREGKRGSKESLTTTTNQ